VADGNFAPAFQQALEAQAKAGDAILDTWIFAAGNAPVDCVCSRRHNVVQGGRHSSRDRIAGRFKATMGRLCEE
jgi:formimidoylglutamate deiminase